MREDDDRFFPVIRIAPVSGAFPCTTRRAGPRPGRGRKAPHLQPRNKKMKRSSSKHLMGGARLLEAQRNLIGDADAVAFEGDNFFRVIGEDANVLETKVNQDLRADAAFVLDHALARRLAIELAALVEMNLRKRAGFPGGIHGKSAASVVEIEKNTAVFLGDSF